MHQSKTSGPHRRWSVLCLAALAALATAVPAVAQTAAEPQPSQEAQRKVDIAEYIVRGNTVLDARDIEQAVTPFLGPARTMTDIEGARDALLAVYQAKGYQSVYVDLPEQQVTEGIVFLQVNETRVGRVRVVGAQYNSPLEVRDRVPALQEGVVPDFTQAQAELTALNRGGKRQVMPLVRQGTLPGTMDVDLKVDDSSPWRGSLGLNNDYSADTRHLRATASVANDNLWQLGHSLSLSFFGAPQDLDQTQVFSGSYIAPLQGTDWSLEASGYVSDSQVATIGGTNVVGKGHAIGLKATYTVPNAGEWYHAFSAGVDFKDNKEALRLGAGSDTVPLKYAPITLSYSGFVQDQTSQLGLNASLVAGTRSSFGYGSNASQFDYKRYKSSPSFLVLKSDVNATYTFTNDLQFNTRVAGQLTDSPLVSTEQIAAGGINSVRGYLAAESVGDTGLVSSVELRSPALKLLDPWVGNWRVYTFMDAARLRLKEPLPQQVDNYSLASVGMGTSFRVGESVSARLDLAYPVKAGVRTERHDTRVSFSLTANY